MRIAMAGCRGIPARWGGVERVVEDITAELSHMGHEVIVYGRGGYVPVDQPPTAGRVIVTPGLGGKHLDAITHTFTAMLDVKRRGVDVLHVHSPGPALTSFIAAGHMPIVFTVHAPDWRRDKWSRMAKCVLEAGLACGMKRASAVTAVSEPLARELSARFGRHVEYVPNGVRPPRAGARADVNDMGLTADDYALFVGRIVPEKRLDLLIKCWAGLNVTSTLAVAGEMCSDAYCRHCRDLAQGLNVKFLGGVYGPRLESLYANAAVVVQPSVLEGMSLVLLEAASHARCIVCSDIEENVALLGEAGVYFRVDDGAQLVAALSRCSLEEAFRRRMGSMALSRAKLFDVSRSARSYEAIYTRLVGGG
ncbi:MAG: glycosyltransferase family 4 protein [Planctomycetes bacterium]|nr:glycosyltransferase family 4 protein [Planctomycetota bacterium]